MNPLTQSKNITILPILIAISLCCFGRLLQVQAVTPAPNGDNNAQLARSNAPYQATSPWRQASFDAAHTANNRLEQILSRSNVGQLTQAWAAAVGVGVLYAPPIVSGGRVFIGSGDGRMFALDAATGAILWVGEQQPLFFGASAAGVTAGGKNLVVASSLYQQLVAYDAQTGAVVWTSAAASDVRASPTFKDGVLYVTNFEGTLNALDATTGVPIWSAPGNCCVYDQAPAVAGGRVFQIRTDDTLTAYDAKDGTQLWSRPGFAVGTLAAYRGKLFYNEYPNLIALDAATGAQLWAAPVVTSSNVGAPAAANGMVFVTASPNIIALNATTGAVVWTARRSVITDMGPVVANGVVYASATNGQDAFDERDGSLLWSRVVSSGFPNTVPVVANGVLYITDPFDQFLRAFTVNP